MTFPYEISVVVCVYNEENNIKPLINRIHKALNTFSFEIIYVDDGSTDRTLDQLKTLQTDKLRIVEMRKNYGQSLALMAGIHQALGEFIVTMDGDLQNDPQDIPHMMQIAKDGDWDLVAGIRNKRKDGAIMRRIPSMMANSLIRWSSGIKIKDYGCTLKLFRHELAKELGIYGELHRFIPVLAQLEGGRITQVDVRHHARQHGKSKYGLSRTIKVLSDLLLILFFKRYLQRPMHLFGNTGVILLIIGVATNLYLLYLKILGQDIWGKPLLLLGILLIIAGLQLITVGLFVELQMRTYYESQGKPPYKIRKIHEMEKESVEKQVL